MITLSMLFYQIGARLRLADAALKIHLIVTNCRISFYQKRQGMHMSVELRALVAGSAGAQQPTSSNLPILPATLSSQPPHRGGSWLSTATKTETTTERTFNKTHPVEASVLHWCVQSHSSQ